MSVEVLDVFPVVADELAFFLRRAGIAVVAASTAGQDQRQDSEDQDGQGLEGAAHAGPLSLSLRTGLAITNEIRAIIANILMFVKINVV